MPASQLIPHPENWRRHPDSQLAALEASFKRIGLTDVLKGYDTPDGTVTLDGHARASLLGDTVVKVAILDVDEDEAREMLTTFDPIGMMALTDHESLTALRNMVDLEEENTLAMLDNLIAESDEWTTYPAQPAPEEPDTTHLLATLTVRCPSAVVEDVRQALGEALTGMDDVYIE